MERKELALMGVPLPEALNAHVDGWDPKIGMENETFTPIEDLREVRINLSSHQVQR